MARNNFIEQFKKAHEQKKRLIYDKPLNRYLITNEKHWQNWNGHTLIVNFEKNNIIVNRLPRDKFRERKRV